MAAVWNKVVDKLPVDGSFVVVIFDSVSASDPTDKGTQISLAKYAYGKWKIADVDEAGELTVTGERFTDDVGEISIKYWADLGTTLPEIINEGFGV